MYNTIRKLTQRGIKVKMTEKSSGGIDSETFFKVKLEVDDTIHDGKSPCVYTSVEKIEPIEKIDRAYYPEAMIDKMLNNAWKDLILNYKEVT
jgi:hypothetical protein